MIIKFRKIRHHKETHCGVYIVNVLLAETYKIFNDQDD